MSHSGTCLFNMLQKQSIGTRTHGHKQIVSMVTLMCQCGTFCVNGISGPVLGQGLTD